MRRILKTYNCKDGRVRARVADDNNNSFVLSYPRILMEEKLGRPLEPYEDVHHIDGNPLNNDLSNLAVIAHGEHQRIHRKYRDTIATCAMCGKEFEWPAQSQRDFYSNLRRRTQAGPFCSKRCVGLYGKQEQIRRNSNAECALNGEASPNGDTVPITDNP